MSANTYRALQTRWDGLAVNKFRLIHRLNTIKITHSGSHTKVEYKQGGGKKASASGLAVWNDTGKWRRHKFEVGDGPDKVVGYSYSKALTFDAGEGHGSKKHRITMTAYSVKMVGTNVKKVLYGYLQQVKVIQNDDSHTGEWR